MTQENVVEEVTNFEPLVICKGCGKIVPRTNLCLYCGSPILFKLHKA